jgi:short-subunit dehydrogenase
MAIYAASKHAVEGYSESMDHEVREHGVRVLLVEPAGTVSEFEANSVEPNSRVRAYDRQRRIAAQVALAVNQDGDDPAVVAKAIVAVATAPKPKVRNPAGPNARCLSALRRVLPAQSFDKQIRRFNHLAG